MTVYFGKYLTNELISVQEIMTKNFVLFSFLSSFFGGEKNPQKKNEYGKFAFLLLYFYRVVAVWYSHLV